MDLIGSSDVTRAVRRLGRRGARRLGRRLRWLSGRLDGLAYRLAGGHPDEAVSDHVVAERVRAALGTELKRRGRPDVHVEVLDHVAYLRGAVDFDGARRVEDATARVAGVVGVESYLDVTEPPAAGAPIHLPSDQLARLLAVARAEGCHPPTDRTAVIGVLGTFAARIPLDELRHVWVHLPGDVRALLQPPVRLGSAPRRLRRPEELYAAVAAASGADAALAQRLTDRLLHEIHLLVPEEADDIEAVLPTPLKPLWERAAQ